MLTFTRVNGEYLRHQGIRQLVWIGCCVSKGDIDCDPTQLIATGYIRSRDHVLLFRNESAKGPIWRPPTAIVQPGEGQTDAISRLFQQINVSTMLAVYSPAADFPMGDAGADIVERPAPNGLLVHHAPPAWMREDRQFTTYLYFQHKPIAVAFFTDAMDSEAATAPPPAGGKWFSLDELDESRFPMEESVRWYAPDRPGYRKEEMAPGVLVLR